MKAIYVAELWPQESGTGYYVRIPDIDGCVTTGKDLMDAVLMARDALSVCLCAMEDHAEAIPAARAMKDLPHEEGHIYTLIDVDTTRYRAETDTRAVRKNVSIPAWMDSLVTRKGINCSQVLQDALRKTFMG